MVQCSAVRFEAAVGRGAVFFQMALTEAVETDANFEHGVFDLGWKSQDNADSERSNDVGGREDIHFVSFGYIARETMIPGAGQMVCLVAGGSVQQLRELWLESPAIAENQAKSVKGCCF